MNYGNYGSNYGNYGSNYGNYGYGLNQLAGIMDGINIGIPYYNTGGYSQNDSMVNIMLNPSMFASPYMRFNGGPGIAASNIFQRRGGFAGGGGIFPAFLGSG